MGYFLDSILLIFLRFVTFDKPSSNNKTIIFMMYLHFPNPLLWSIINSRFKTNRQCACRYYCNTIYADVYLAPLTHHAIYDLELGSDNDSNQPHCHVLIDASQQNDLLTQCWLKVGPASQTACRRWGNISKAYRVGCHIYIIHVSLKMITLFVTQILSSSVKKFGICQFL